MDLNSAISLAEVNIPVRDDLTMATGWTIRLDPKEKLLYYHRPTGERAHKVRFSDAHRSSFAWRAARKEELTCPPEV